MVDTREKVGTWLANMGARYSGSPWSLSESGVSSFRYEGDVELVVEVASADSPIGVYVDLGPVPVEVDLPWLTTLLEANFLGMGTGGATIGIHPATNDLAIGFTLPCALLTEESFEGLLCGLLDQAVQWRGRLKAMTSELTSADGSSATENIFV